MQQHTKQQKMHGNVERTKSQLSSEADAGIINFLSHFFPRSPPAPQRSAFCEDAKAALFCNFLTHAGVGRGVARGRDAPPRDKSPFLPSEEFDTSGAIFSLERAR
jgi:hypothetical protein